MKYIFLVVSVAFTLMGCSGNMDVSPGNRTTMEIISEYDAGEVVKGEFITAKFNVTNTGDYPLVIADVKASCTCTVAKKPEEPIAPGESAEIIAQVDTDKTRIGSVVKSVTVMANTDPPKEVVLIKATVLKN
ncbi:MAG: DUF1573 domain-containing protein [Flavobacteriales bacterium]|nr:DUF1573 domain-containing protein [Flavobacteriales bacterium]